MNPTIVHKPFVLILPDTCFLLFINLADIYCYVYRVARYDCYGP